MTSGPNGTIVDTQIARLNRPAPRCRHGDGLSPVVVAMSAGCLACQALAEEWTGLLMCLTCGWVACSDDSPHRHAREHYEETDHPLVVELSPGSHWRWCYVHGQSV
jgi:uncharacterized UBP type Zn finger protein